MVYFFLGLSLAYVFGCYLLAKSYLSPGRIYSPTPAKAKQFAIPNGEHPVPAWVSNGLEKGSPSGKAVFILVHGYGGNRGSWADTMMDLVDKGFEVVVPAMPGHDTSPDDTSGFGVKESEVVLACSRWARSKAPDAKIVYVGVSMGGAACWLALGKDPSSADAIVTEGAFPKLEEAIDRHFESSFRGAPTILAPVRRMASWMSRLDAATVNPVEGAEKWRGPALIVHCADDRLFPLSFSQRISKAASCDLWVIPDARHAQGYGSAREEYLRRLVEMAGR